MEKIVEGKRLSKVLAAAGVASRRAAEELIFAGRVKVNGKIVMKPQELVDGSSDAIFVDGKPIGKEEHKVYYILNKPKGYICSSKKVNRTKIVLELFDGDPLRLFTVGRLDKDTEGLLIVTNDGHFAQKIIHPSQNIHKEYLVKVDHDLNPDHIDIITRGISIEGTHVKPVKVTKVRKGTVKIVVAEGKKHEVRELINAAGIGILELTRIRIGGLHLGSLPTGCWREVSSKELEAIFG